MIRKAEMADIADIMNFIKLYWKTDHILAVNRDFFEYQYVNGKEVCFIVSEDDNKNIDGVLGYIPYGERNRDIFSALWKVRKNSNPFLGVELLEYLLKHCDVRTLACAGINLKTVRIYEYLGYTVGKYKHFYRLNKNKHDYKIAVINDPRVIEGARCRQNDLIKISNFEELERIFCFNIYMKSQPLPNKERWYIKKRYFEHPIYQYDIYGIRSKDKNPTILFFRQIRINGTSALRIVDIIGDRSLLKTAILSLDKLMQQNDVEYIDCYEAGVPDEIFTDAGFIDRTHTSNIIPNYFEPFVQENVDIHYFSTVPGIVLFKADGDQDRPSQANAYDRTGLPNSERSVW